MFTFDGTHFSNSKGLITSIHAKQTKAGRWQYRMDDAKGKLIASGVSPAEFVKQFWYGTLEETAA